MDVHRDAGASREGPTDRQASAADRKALHSLLSCLSHELSRPLVSLRAGFDLLLDDPAAGVTDEQRKHLSTMVSICDQMLRLTRGYLDFASLVNGARLPRPGAFSLGAMVRELDRQYRPLAVARGIGWEAACSAPDAPIVADASLCQQIFGNLVGNALKYTPPGGHVRVVGAAGDDAWSLVVEDDGPGIPGEAQQQVFEPFFRLERDEHSRIEGNGLGLAICRELTDRLGGSIVLRSAPGAGTAVEVRFPRTPGDAPGRGSGGT